MYLQIIIDYVYRSNSVDFCPNEVQCIDDCIHINMYDEIIVDILEDNRIRETNIHQRLERHWLGGCVIPISALFNSSQVSKYISNIEGIVVDCSKFYVLIEFHFIINNYANNTRLLLILFTNKYQYFHIE